MKKVTVAFNAPNLNNLSRQVADSAAQDLVDSFCAGFRHVVTLYVSTTEVHYISAKDIAGISILGVADDN